MIPSFLITWLTFPGVIVHEFAHQIFCKLTSTPIHKVCYFRFGNPAGYVIHEQPSSPWKHILIGFGPLVVNSLLGLILALIALPCLLSRTPLSFFLYLALMWLAISIAMHSFPSTGDAKSIWHGIWNPHSSFFTKLIGTPMVILIWIGAIGSIFWLDFLYGIAICIGIPEALDLRPR